LAEVHRQLKAHQHVTLQLLWEEYRQSHAQGYGYSRYVAVVFMLRSESSHWIGVLSAALCSNINGHLLALQAFQESHQRRHLGTSRRSLTSPLRIP
jgi:hypothetical protein